jgi:hypothetical protein
MTTTPRATVSGVTSSETLHRHARDVDAFATALHRFLSVMEAQHNGFLYDSGATWVPRPGQEGEAARLKAEVDRLSGRAAYAFAAAGSHGEWKPRGTMQWQPVNPAAGWLTILEGDPRFDAETIFSCCSQALGILEMKAEAAVEYERHRVRRAFRWAARLTGSGLRPVARWAARGAGALALAGVTYWLGWS